MEDEEQVVGRFFEPPPKNYLRNDETHKKYVEIINTAEKEIGGVAKGADQYFAYCAVWDLLDEAFSLGFWEGYNHKENGR